MMTIDSEGKKETNMTLASSAFEKIFPTAEELWDRGGAEMHNEEIYPGHHEKVPFFDLEISKFKKLGVEGIENERGRTIGKATLLSVGVNDGAERLARVWKLNSGEHKNPDIFSFDSTALGTTIQGYTKERMRRDIAANHIDGLQVGAEHSGGAWPGLLSALQIGRMVRATKMVPTMSLARAAQAEQLIASRCADEFDLPGVEFGKGDSRAGMIKPASSFYAKEYGMEMPVVDIKALCCYEKLSSEHIDEPLKWALAETLGGAAIVAGMIAEGELPRLAKTASSEPAFLIGATAGTIPYLLSGELSATMQWMNEDIAGQVTRYGKDRLSSEEGMDSWRGYKNINRKEVPKGLHAHLLQEKAHTPQRVRQGKLSEMQMVYGNVSRMNSEDKAHVYGSNSTIVRESDGHAQVA